MSTIKPTPAPTLRRLPKYLEYLHEAKRKGIASISCTTIANDLKLDSVQIRKDIGITGIVGKPKTGYNVDELIHSIEKHLNWDDMSSAILVGAGNLGKAFLGYENFKKYGLNIVVAFDKDRNKIDGNIFNVPILHIDKMVDLTYRMKIHIGIITAPADEAQEIAELMILSGIRAIWNFAPRHLDVPDNIYVENAELSSDISHIKRRLKEITDKEKKYSESN
ncbi:MAG: redox-sensing transcriptional repressor Rex [Ignavibacteria bacterium]|nr:redox-sensing transcriptional repressor Rex [Ignavibacteria bacterium]